MISAGVRLHGEFQESGFAEAQWLAERDGQFIQLTEPLYRVLEAADGTRTVGDIAAHVSQTTDWEVTEEQAHQLLVRKLVPLGLLTLTGGSGVSHRAAVASPLLLKRRRVLLSASALEPLARVLQHLYNPAVVGPVLTAAVVAHFWLYILHGVSEGFQTTLNTPGLLPLGIGVMVIAGIFHEFGHAAALRYGGGRARGMGAGLYLIYPAFYTDTTDSYRLSRGARVRTDLGGFYFYLIFALGLMGAYLATGHEFLLFVVVLINLDILYQCIPFVRLDGYWTLADLTGIPDLFSFMGPFARSLRRGGPPVPEMRPTVRRVFVIYTVLAIPALAVLLIMFLLRAPSILAATWESCLVQANYLSRAFAAGDFSIVALSALQMMVLALILVGIVLLLVDLVRKVITAALPRIRRRRAALA